VGVGVEGAAGPAWLRQLERHPSIHRAPGRPAGLDFFARFWSEPFSDADAHAYAGYFPRPPGGLAGEWSGSYGRDFWTPPLIDRAAPEARIVLMTCDPLQRYARRRGAHRGAAWSDREAMGAFTSGLQGALTRRLIETFDRERILVLQEEACRLDPAGQLERSFAFLGLPVADLGDTSQVPDLGPETAITATLDAPLRAALTEAYAADLAELSELMPSVDLGLWPAASAAGITSTSPTAPAAP
jgi:hypothetical protein